MGLTITATISYGCWYDPERLHNFLDEDDDFDFDAIITRHAGIEPLDYSDYPERDYSVENEKYQAAVKEWDKANNVDAYYSRCREAINAAPLRLDYAGHGDNPIYVIYLRGRRFEAYWSPESVPDSWTIDDRDIARAKGYADELGIPWESPEWLLYPYYSY